MTFPLVPLLLAAFFAGIMVAMMVGSVEPIMRGFWKVCYGIRDVWRWCTDDVFRMERRNRRLERRIKAIEYEAARRTTREISRKQLKQAHNTLMQKMADVCYKHPDIWVDKESK